MAHESYIRLVPGARYAVLMVHGILGSPEHFRDLLPLVPENWSVMNILLDGHGAGPKDFANSSIDRWRSQVFTCITSLLENHEKVFLVAHSMGTLFSLQASLRWSNRIGGLFLLGSPTRVFVQPATALNSVLMTFGYVDRSNRSFADMQREVSVRTTPWLPVYLTWIPRFLELFGEIRKTRKLIPRITVPTQVFQSKYDELVHFSSRHDFENHPFIRCTCLCEKNSGHFGYGDGDLALLQACFSDMLPSI
jgi:carboxylesterase